VIQEDWKMAKEQEGDQLRGGAGNREWLAEKMAIKAHGGPSRLASTELCRGCLKSLCPEKRMRYSKELIIKPGKFPGRQ
jgi:hypothetical protein